MGDDRADTRRRGLVDGDTLTARILLELALEAALSIQFRIHLRLLTVPPAAITRLACHNTPAWVDDQDDLWRKILLLL